jgi:hypothetical protein
VVKLVKNDDSLKSLVLNQQNDPPELYVEEVVELDSFEGINMPGQGYTFYPENES